MADLQKLKTIQSTTADQLIQQRVDLAATGQAIDNLARRKQEVDTDLALARNEINTLTQDLRQAREKTVELESLEQTRREDHTKMAATLKAIQDKIQSDREAEEERNHAQGIERLEKLKFTWSNHQQAVKQAIKAICQKHTIECVAKVAFKGDPDNTVKIADEFIVFDAKSPSGDDLNNFPHYIPAYVYYLADYHGKRRIQVDTYFIHQFMELALKCENDLPAEILHDAIEFEKAEKLNPPFEKRAKAIPMAELEQAANKVRNDAADNGILLPGDQLASSLNTILLYIEK